MAARTQPTAQAAAPQLVDLRSVRAADLEDLLGEEIDTWRDSLHWDFAKSAELVERFVDLRALNGYALVENGETIGYSYFVYEDHKGLIGDVYVRRRSRRPGHEERLVQAVLDSMAMARVSRIEAQLMMASSLRDRAASLRPALSAFPRCFMLAETGDPYPAGRPRRRILIERWSENHHDAAAALIAEAYSGHVDSRINDQYRSTAGARKFLYNIVQYPGCGDFFRPASFSAFDLETGRLSGLSLASLVSPACGHITQVCVMPWMKGMGVGYELMRHSLNALAENRCRHTSLTVTACNHEAIRLYEQMNFRTVRRFNAYVWEA